SPPDARLACNAAVPEIQPRRFARVVRCLCLVLETLAHLSPMRYAFAVQGQEGPKGKLKLCGSDEWKHCSRQVAGCCRCNRGYARNSVSGSEWGIRSSSGYAETRT